MTPRWQQPGTGWTAGVPMRQETTLAALSEVEGLRALSEEAMRGPWGTADGLGAMLFITGNDGDVSDYLAPADAEFIVEAVNFCRDLLATPEETRDA